MADRYAYIPFLGLFLMTVWLIADWAADWNKSRQVPARWLAIQRFVVCCAACLTYVKWATCTIRKRSGARVGVDSGQLHRTRSFGRSAAQAGKNRRGHRAYSRRARHPPDDWPANLILAAYEQSQGDTAAATARYQMVALRASKPSQRAAAYNDLGTPIGKRGSAAGERGFRTILRLVPSQPMLMVTLGLIAQKNATCRRPSANTRAPLNCSTATFGLAAGASLRLRTRG